MRTLVLCLAGAADRPVEDLGGRTPLEAAATPHLDRVAAEGRLGRVVAAPAGMRPEEVAFVLALYGLDPSSYGDIGATLDAAGLGVEVGSLDQALRLSLVTADERTILDPTAGHVSRDEAELLLSSLGEALADDALSLHAGAAGSHLLVWAGARDVRLSTVPPYEVVERALDSALPRGTGIGRLLAAMQRSAALLPGHEVNELRRDLGENPATLIWPWSPGVSLPLPSMKERTGLSALAVGVDNAFRGAAVLQGIPVEVPAGSTGRMDSMLRAKTDAALAGLEAHDLVFLHVAALEAASHARDFVGKVELLERIDGYVIGPLLEAATRRGDLRLVVLAGPTASTESGRVLDDPVPFALFGPGVRSHRRSAFTEVGAQQSGFRVDRAHELLDFVLHLGR
ncbi:MAG: hypothetical protein H6806_08075 [Planctomycetes bacterium]|nr:hypothetical protein [Planctomycetota bacterium]MCB9829702.1 hypothetical protein [Planctomycetota bacterium]MCB9900045.1 hypothetical protein [Planctomycetota bacterium]